MSRKLQGAALRSHLTKTSPAPKPLPGNQLAAKHYGRATGPIPGTEVARSDILAALSAAAPVRGADGHVPVADGPTLELAARSLARVRAIDGWLEEHGYFGPGGKMRAAVEYADKATKTAADLLAALGMTPRSRAALGLDMARTVDLATAMSEEDPARRRDMMRDAGLREGS